MSSLDTVIDELKVLVRQAESNCRQFLLFSRDFKRLVTNVKVINYFIEQLFQSYLAFYDELLLLIQGAVFSRKYHGSEHRRFSHTRDKVESKLYQNAKYLSMCSIDGIRYECARNHNKKYNKTVDGLSDRIIICLVDLKRNFREDAIEALAKFGIVPRISIDHDRGETIQAETVSGIVLFNMSRCDMPEHPTRQQALSVTVDDLDSRDQLSIRRCGAPERLKRLIDDSDDQEERDTVEKWRMKGTRAKFTPKDVSLVSSELLARPQKGIISEVAGAAEHANSACLSGNSFGSSPTASFVIPGLTININTSCPECLQCTIPDCPVKLQRLKRQPMRLHWHW